jgi:hypothetical protein
MPFLALLTAAFAMAKSILRFFSSSEIAAVEGFD